MGALLYDSGAPAAVDATVAILAVNLNATVVTSDPVDITKLAACLNGLNRVEIVNI